MAKLDENDTPLPESMLPDFDTGEKIDPVIDYERLSAMIAAKVVALTTGTCKCGKPPDACCQTT